jgi:uncharacterized protein (UPF0548 family)
MPLGYNHDTYSQRLGQGAGAFFRAKEAVQQWRMLPRDWVRPWPEVAPIEAGQTVLINFCLMGIWGTAGCRIVYTLDEPYTFGFAYGSLSGHVERGEERFWVEWREDDSVWYHIRVFSRPSWWPVWLAYPISRAYQRRFGRHSCASMQAAVQLAQPVAPQF